MSEILPFAPKEAFLSKPKMDIIRTRDLIIKRLRRKIFPEKHRAEHLKEGIKPITVFIDTPEQFRQSFDIEKKFINTWLMTRGERISNIDLYGNPENLNYQGFKNGGEKTYVISQVDSRGKFSKGFTNCTGLVAVGQDNKTGENISLMSHENPGFFLEGEQNKNKFINDLRQRLEELQKKCVDSTIDAGIIGGFYPKWFFSKTTYIESIKLLSEEVTRAFSFEPLVIAGPKTNGLDEDHVFFDTEQRNIYIMRSDVGKSFNESFYPSDLDNRMKKWNKQLGI